MKLESGLDHNMARKIREKLLMKKADLARKAGISSLPIDPARGISAGRVYHDQCLDRLTGKVV